MPDREKVTNEREAHREKVTNEREAQGLLPTITDPATLAKVATLIGRHR